MLGIGVFAPRSFSNRDGMPQIKINSLPLIDGASHAWIADNITPGGKVANLYDLAGTAHFRSNWPTNAALQPAAVDASGRTFLSFNGAALDVAVSLPAVKTVIAVGSLPAAPASKEQLLIHGGSGPSFALSAASGKFKAYGGANLIHTKDADPNPHVFILSQDGADSVLSIDGVEVTGNAGSNALTAMRLGGNTSAFNQSTIRCVQILPYAAGPQDRIAITSKLRETYGI